MEYSCYDFIQTDFTLIWFTNNIISMKCCVWPSNINIVYELPWCIACSSGPSSNNWYNLLRLNTENCKFHFSPISFELAVSLQIFVCMVWFFYLLCAVVNILFKIYVFSRPIKKQYLWAGIYLPLVISLTTSYPYIQEYHWA